MIDKGFIQHKLSLFKAIKLRNKAIDTGADKRIVQQIQKVISEKTDALLDDGRRMCDEKDLGRR